MQIESSAFVSLDDEVDIAEMLMANTKPIIINR